MQLNKDSKEIDALMLKSVLEQIDEANAIAEADLKAGSVIEIEITEEESSYLAQNEFGEWYWKRPDAA